MLYYDWPKIYRASKGNVKECWYIFYLIGAKHLPKNRRDPTYKYHSMNFGGLSFLINPESLINYHDGKNTRDVVSYVALAAKRNLAEYLSFSTVTLDQKVVELPLKLYKHNKLLRIEDGIIHFKFEENRK